MTEAANQLGWWLRLPPTNLIDRGDHLRFRYALYLMIHQVATVLYGLNGLPDAMYYPSRLEGARNRLNGLSRAPENAGDALWTLATERDPEKAWAAASLLMRETLALLSESSDEPGVRWIGNATKDPSSLISPGILVSFMPWPPKSRRGCGYSRV